MVFYIYQNYLTAVIPLKENRNDQSHIYNGMNNCCGRTIPIARMRSSGRQPIPQTRAFSNGGGWVHKTCKFKRCTITSPVNWNFYKNVNAEYMSPIYYHLYHCWEQLNPFCDSMLIALCCIELLWNCAIALNWTAFFNKDFLNFSKF